MGPWAGKERSQRTRLREEDGAGAGPRARPGSGRHFAGTPSTAAAEHVGWAGRAPLRVQDGIQGGGRRRLTETEVAPQLLTAVQWARPSLDPWAPACPSCGLCSGLCCVAGEGVEKGLKTLRWAARGRVGDRGARGPRASNYERVWAGEGVFADADGTAETLGTSPLQGRKPSQPTRGRRPPTRGRKPSQPTQGRRPPTKRSGNFLSRQLDVGSELARPALPRTSPQTGTRLPHLDSVSPTPLAWIGCTLIGSTWRLYWPV